MLRRLRLSGMGCAGPIELRWWLYTVSQDEEVSVAQTELE